MGKLSPPWSVVEHESSYEVVAKSGQSLAHVYFNTNPYVGEVRPRLTRDEARRVAANIAKLPGLLGRG